VKEEEEEKEKCILSQFWKLEVQNQNLRKAMSPPELWIKSFLASS
jgi:hypothetical protein